MGHLERDRHNQRVNLVIEPPQSLVFSMLAALTREQLHSQADTEQRLPSFEFSQQKLVEAETSYAFHGLAKRAYTGKNEPLGIPDILMVGGNARVVSKPMQRVANGTYVPHTVVHNRDHMYVLRDSPPTGFSTIVSSHLSISGTGRPACILVLSNFQGCT